MTNKLLVATTDEVSPRDLKSGIYRIYWTSGGESLAAIGVTTDGGRWLAPINWVAPSDDFTDWDEIVLLELVL